MLTVHVQDSVGMIRYFTVIFSIIKYQTLYIEILVI